MAASDRRKRSERAFDASTPLDPDHLREWVEHLAQQLVDTDSVEVTLIQKTSDGRRTESLRVRAPYYHGPCPGRVGEPPDGPYPPPPPDPEPHPS